MSEHSVVAALMQAIAVGNTDTKGDLGQRLLDGVRSDSWRSGRFIELGAFLALEDLDPALADDDDSDELGEGNLATWRQRAAERLLAWECARKWVVLEVRQAARVAYVAALAPQEGPGRDLEFVAAFATYGEVMNALKARGFTGERDWRERSPKFLAGPG